MYLTTVEFHQKEKHRITKKDYALLYEEMRKKNFDLVIKSRKGQLHKLPSAEYNKISIQTIDEVLNDAMDAALTAKNKSPNIKSFSVFTVRYTEANWYNLEAIKE